MKPLEILVPRWADAQNSNPQNLNAVALLSRFARPEAKWRTFFYDSPAPGVAVSRSVGMVKLWRRRLWKYHVAALYQSSVDAIFYPGVEWEDKLGLNLRRISGRKIPLIATMESLVGDERREAELSELAGHPVHCARVKPETLQWIDSLYRSADLIIAISPFLARMGSHLYGPRFRTQMLGLDSAFCPSTSNFPNSRPLVLNLASFQERKRPELFVELAAKFPQADFAWYGSGSRLEEFRRSAQSRGLSNLRFPGAVRHDELPALMNSADIFVLPSNSEGVPKVTQEAAACGLAVVIFGFYESPSVVHEKNGYVVWNDAELFDAVGRLIADRELREQMGAAGATMAKEWNWDLRAPQWENEVLGFLGR